MLPNSDVGWWKVVAVANANISNTCFFSYQIHVLNTALNQLPKIAEAKQVENIYKITKTSNNKM